MPAPVCYKLPRKVCWEHIIYPNDTPRHTFFVHTCSIHFKLCHWSPLWNFSRFNLPIDKASMTLLHYVVSCLSQPILSQYTIRNDEPKLVIKFLKQVKASKNFLYWGNIFFKIRQKWAYGVILRGAIVLYSSKRSWIYLSQPTYWGRGWFTIG